ncbi:MAG: TonB family protein [Methylococcaceae bacterium]
MFSIKWKVMYKALMNEEKPTARLMLLTLLVVALHIQSVLWLSHPMLEAKVLERKPIEIALLPVILKQVAEPIKPKPIVKPEVKSLPPKPKPLPKPKPVPVLKPVPIIKPLVVPKLAPVLKQKPVVPRTVVVKAPSPEVVAPIEAIAQTPREPLRPAVVAPAPKETKAVTPMSSNSNSKQEVDAKPAVHSHSSGGGVSSGVVALERVQPKYPARAMSRHIEGSVTLAFTISVDGSVESPVVVSAQPPDIFDEAALQAIRKWTFKQKMLNGAAVEQRATQTLQFKLSNE